MLWPVASAQSYGGDIAGQELSRIEVAGPKAAPSMSEFGRAIGDIKPVGLFYIDATRHDLTLWSLGGNGGTGCQKCNKAYQLLLRLPSQEEWC